MGETNCLKVTEQSWGWWLTPMIHAGGRDRRRAVSSRPARLQSGMLSDPLPQMEAIKSTQHTVIDGVIYKLGKRGRKNRVEEERGGQDEGSEREFKHESQLSARPHPSDEYTDACLASTTPKPLTNLVLSEIKGGYHHT